MCKMASLHLHRLSNSPLRIIPSPLQILQSFTSSQLKKPQPSVFMKMRGEPQLSVKYTISSSSDALSDTYVQNCTRLTFNLPSFVCFSWLVRISSECKSMIHGRLTHTALGQSPLCKLPAYSTAQITTQINNSLYLNLR